VGVVTEFGVPTPTIVLGITAGPDGNIWFTEGAKIGRIHP
jgi:streptogramin lyase